jgi:centromere protein C
MVGRVADVPPGLAYPKHLLSPKQVPNSSFLYQKVFGEDQFIAAGMVVIPVGASKPAKHSKDNSYVGVLWSARVLGMGKS